MLMPAALFTKFVGLFYKIPLLFVVGVCGMAHFLAAYHLFAAALALFATGLPTAISLQIAKAAQREEGASRRRILCAALLLFLSLGALCSLLLFVFAVPIANALAIRGACHAIRAIAPALFLATFTGAAKGYFQGQNRMGTTAFCEVLESAGKLCFGLFFAFLAKRRGESDERVAAAAIFGITVGLLLSALFLLVFLFCDRPTKRERTRVPVRLVLRDLLKIALPITLGSALFSLLSLVDTALIASRLQSAGFSVTDSHTMYSSYGNLAVPLYNLVPSLLAPVTLSLMPLLGGSLARRDDATAIEVWRSAIRTVLLFAMPATLGLAVFARPLLSLLFAGQEAAVSLAAPLLSLLALSVLPAVLVSQMGTALQAAGRPFVPVLAAGLGGVCKLLTEYTLLGVRGVYLFAAPISTLFCMLVVLLVESRALRRALGEAPVLPFELWRPFGAALPALVFGVLLQMVGERFFGGRVWVLLSVSLVALLYLPLALLFGAVKCEDVLAMPCGKSLVAILERCKLLKGCNKNDDSTEEGNHSCKNGIQRR